jgi:hypothetical protein
MQKVCNFFFQTSVNSDVRNVLELQDKRKSCLLFWMNMFLVKVEDNKVEDFFFLF